MKQHNAKHGLVETVNPVRDLLEVTEDGSVQLRVPYTPNIYITYPTWTTSIGNK